MFFIQSLSFFLIDDYTAILPNREDLVLQAVATQPVSVGICGSDYAFQLYSSVRVLLYDTNFITMTLEE